MDLFDASDKTREPLAARMRPRNLDEYIGQDHIVGKGRLLRRAIAADRLSSVIFYGPPGSGKTTLARVIANHTKSNFITLNAVLTGVQNIRAAIEQADQQRKVYQKKTILFVDEVHRWNKSQQDALLPWVENGTIILVGATTENPFFEVNKALVSRSRVFQLKSLTESDLAKAAQLALSDKERGYGRYDVQFEDGALEHLIQTANGDARSLLNALELAVETTPPFPATDAPVFISKEAAEESIQKKVVLYDRDGDYHYDIISAFIKSLRGRDPDAAMYWLARMIAAGEDPDFIFRRMLISACEDTGLADPFALGVVESCAAAFDRVGLPEGRYHLAHAALYLATVPKSNSSMAFFDALSAVSKEDADVPNHLKDGNRDAEGFGHGAGYLYPHAYRDHWVAQQYLPDALLGRVFYTPGTQGYEGSIREEVLARREAQIAELLEERQEHNAPAAEQLTFTPESAATARLYEAADSQWRRRLSSNKAQVFSALRDAMTQTAELSRHSRSLIWNADDGLLLWHISRREREGLTCGVCRSAEGRNILAQYARNIDELEQPLLILAADTLEQTLAQTADVEFDRFFLRDPFLQKDSAQAFIEQLRSAQAHFAPQCKIIISQRIPRGAQRLHGIIERQIFAKRGIPQNIAQVLSKLSAAEEAFYSDEGNPVFSWNEETLAQEFRAAGFAVQLDAQELTEKRQPCAEEIARWLSKERSAYGKALAAQLRDEELRLLSDTLTSAAQRMSFSWGFVNAVLTAEKAAPAH